MFAGEPRPDYEFNVWTKPDCGGTPFENGNRFVNHLFMRHLSIKNNQEIQKQKNCYKRK